MIAIADSSPMMRRWLLMGVAPLGGTVLEASDGVELLYLAGEHGPFDLVIANRTLPAISGEQVLTMMRTAGDRSPFMLIAPFCRRSVRALVDKLGRATLVDDPLGGAELLRAARNLINECSQLTEFLSEPPFPTRPAKHGAKVPALSLAEPR